MILEGQFGEDMILLKEIVRQGEFVEEITLAEYFLLTKPRHQKEDLSGEGIGIAIPIKVWKKRIIFELFVHFSGAITSSELLHQSGLSHADDAFDSHILGGLSLLRVVQTCRVLLALKTSVQQHFNLGASSVRSSADLRGEITLAVGRKIPLAL